MVLPFILNQFRQVSIANQTGAGEASKYGFYTREFGVLFRMEEARDTI
jgi:hypothetical protein